jgi:hypothetical protein
LGLSPQGGRGREARDAVTARLAADYSESIDEWLGVLCDEPLVVEG